MTRVLVTGGAGTLGTEVVKELLTSGCCARVMSRKPAPATLPEGVEWAQADVLTGDGVMQAAQGADVIVHAATNAMRKNAYDTEVEGTRRMLDAAQAAGVRHFIYISIVGIDRVPFPYYKAKLAAEHVIKDGATPYSIVRITQFHTLIDLLLGAVTLLPGVSLTPTDFQFQTIAPHDAAQSVAQVVCGRPGGLLPDIGGPEVMTLGAMAPAWLKARRRRRLIVPLWMPGAVARGYRAGHNTCPDRRVGRQTWQEWLAQTYPNGWT